MPVGDMIAFADAGITTFDCADIYTGVEELIGAFRAALSRSARRARRSTRIKVHTKFVPDLDILPRITKADVEGVIDQSLRRLKMERLDLVQFHWWDYAAPAGSRRRQLARRTAPRRQDPTRSAAPISTPTHMLAHGRAPACRWSRCRCSIRCSTRGRPSAWSTAAAEHGVALLCYGTVAGGFLGDRWLGAPEPADALREPLADQIQADHRRFRRLGPVPGAARRRCGASPTATAVDIATVASAAMLTRPAVAGVIVGARNRSHLASNLAISSVALTAEDHAEIDAVLAQASDARRRCLRARARPQRPPRLDHEIQSQQGSRLTAALRDGRNTA